jgi:hypothetical protein
VCDSHAPPLTFGDIQALEGSYVHCDFHSIVQSVIAKFKGPRRIAVWQHALACSTTLALLAGLFWLVPWQVQHDGPAIMPQSMPLQGGEHTAEETARPLVAPASEGSAPPSTPAPLSPERPHTSAPPEEPTEILDAQAMQGLVTRLETARSNPEEHLNTRAMDRLLARLESADRTGSLPSSRPKAARKRGVRVLPRAGDHGVPGSVSPPRDGSAPLSAAAGMHFPAAAR